jgi:hypothetical protein
MSSLSYNYFFTLSFKSKNDGQSTNCVRGSSQDDPLKLPRGTCITSLFINGRPHESWGITINGKRTDPEFSEEKHTITYAVSPNSPETADFTPDKVVNRMELNEFGLNTRAPVHYHQGKIQYMAPKPWSKQMVSL